MKKYLLLIMFIAAAAFTYVSCNTPDDWEPTISATTTLCLEDQFNPDINTLSGDVWVYKYLDAGNAVLYSHRENVHVDANNPFIENVGLPLGTAYQIVVELKSDDCSLTCAGSCVHPPNLMGGYPVFHGSMDDMSGMTYASTTFAALELIGCD